MVATTTVPQDSTPPVRGAVRGEAAASMAGPTKGEVLSSRTGDGSETSGKQETGGSGRASDWKMARTIPNDGGMKMMTCDSMMCPTAPSRSMNTLEEIFNETTLVSRLRPAMPRVLLASQSPRRRQLLAQHGIDHAAIASGVDDGVLIRGGVTPAEWVASLAYFKAAAARERITTTGYNTGEAVILGADTVVRKGESVIGQPVDAADAERIIRILQDGEHDVLTGVAFVDAATGRRDMWVDRARVRVGEIGDARITEYVQTGAWRGKAGAYNLSERIADGWPIEYDGDPGTIMGLPMQRLSERLIAFRQSCVATTN